MRLRAAGAVFLGSRLLITESSAYLVPSVLIQQLAIITCYRLAGDSLTNQVDTKVTDKEARDDRRDHHPQLHGPRTRRAHLATWVSSNEGSAHDQATSCSPSSTASSRSSTAARTARVADPSTYRRRRSCSPPYRRGRARAPARPGVPGWLSRLARRSERRRGHDPTPPLSAKSHAARALSGADRRRALGRLRHVGQSRTCSNAASALSRCSRSCVAITLVLSSAPPRWTAG